MRQTRSANRRCVSVDSLPPSQQQAAVADIGDEGDSEQEAAEEEEEEDSEDGWLPGYGNGRKKRAVTKRRRRSRAAAPSPRTLACSASSSLSSASASLPFSVDGIVSSPLSSSSVSAPLPVSLASSLSAFPSSSPYTCLQCSAPFLDAYCLRQHAKEAHGERRFDCAPCGRRFRDKYDLDAHLRTQRHAAQLLTTEWPAAEDSGVTAAVDGQQPSPSLPPLLPPLDDANLRVSLPTSTPAPHPDVTLESAVGLSLSGGGVSASSPLLPVHPAADGDGAEPASFTALLELSTALTQAHQSLAQPTTPSRRRRCADSSTLCEACNRHFPAPSLLANHLRSHTGEQPFACQFPGCTKRFSERSNLVKHGRSHSGERPFCCEVAGCGRSFSLKCNLQAHARMHTGEKPFACRRAGCRKRFRYHINLRRHKEKLQH